MKNCVPFMIRISSLLSFFLIAIVFSVSTLAQKSELRLEILNGHSAGVGCVAVSSDGKFALTGSADRTALLWDLSTSKQLRRFVGHEDEVSAVQFSKDGQYVLTASWDKTARLWETATGRQVRVFVENRNGVLIGHSSKIVSAAISPDGSRVVTAGHDGTIRIWDANTAKQLFMISEPDWIESLAFSPDGKYILSGGRDGVARIYDSSTANLVREFRGHTASIKSVIFSSDGKRVLTGSTDMSVRIWDAATGAQLRAFSIGSEVKSIALTPGDREAVVAAGETSLIDLSSGEQLWKRDVSGRAAAITPNGEKAFVACDDYDRYVPIFDLAIEKKRQKEAAGAPAKTPDPIPGMDRIEAYKDVFFLGGVTGVVTSAAFSPNFRYLVTGATVGTAAVWNLETGAVKTRAAMIPGFSSAVAFSNVGDLAAFAVDSRIKIINAESGREIRTLEGHTWTISAVAFSPDGKTLASASWDRTINLWDVETGRLLRTLTGHTEWVVTLSFNAAGTLLATGSAKTVKVWDVATGKELADLHGKSSSVTSVAFAPDGKSVAIARGSTDDILKIGIGGAAAANSITLWNFAIGEETVALGSEFKMSANKFVGYMSVAYSRDGKYLVAGASDGKVFVRDNTTKALTKLEGHTGGVNSVTFSADGKFVLSGSDDSTTRIWNMATGSEVAKLVTFVDDTWAVIDPQGRYDAPNGGEIMGIQWVYGTETIALNQLKDVYYTPNLLPRLLGYNKEPLRPVPDLNSLKLFPKIVEQRIDETNARLTVKLQNRGGGIGEVRILVNGKLATEDARDAKLKADPNVAEAVVTYDLKGSAGFDPTRKNTIEVITNNYDPATRKGYISSRGAGLVFAGSGQAEAKRPTLYAIVGGVSDYNGTEIDLNFAAKDAEDFANALGVGARRLFCPAEKPDCTDKVKIKLLTTNGKDGTQLPTKANFRAAFAEVAKEARPEDVLVVYLSGHGSSLNLDGTDTYLYLTQDADKASKDALANRDYREAATISNDELTSWLTQEKWSSDRKGIQAGKQVMILDTCAAGAFEKKVSLQATKDLSADQIRALERLKDRTGFTILMGSASDAVSYEASQYGQGLLTYSLLQAMKGASLRDGKFVDTQLLFGYAADEVPKMVANLNGGIQRPRIFGSTGIDIGLMDEQAKASIKLESIKPVFLPPRFSSGDEGDDPLDLIGSLKTKLKEMSSVRPRGPGQTTGAELIFIDADAYPGAYRVTGTYTIEGDMVRVKTFLRKDGKTIATLSEVVATKETILEELSQALSRALPKSIGN